MRYDAIANPGHIVLVSKIGAMLTLSLTSILFWAMLFI